MPRQPYSLDPRTLAQEICVLHKIQFESGEGESVAVAHSQAFGSTIGKLPDFIEKGFISLVDALYVMQLFMRYRSGNSKLSLIGSKDEVARIATKQEWELIQLLLSIVTNKSVRD